ncbi:MULTISPECIES: hypothetical protein [unclassified Leptolyngbya]|uniref:hypothetical protein n=1 Tax=unclassified Leptolyngbya TaxID=2650499 RepID=UPI001684A414|nr:MULTISPECIES: hypothetical protein [unclassified Leptolyngbya]MBD1913758.1 hypothetical protein [Leptolyngbya sp. FACHB-8]MBD2153206.1 hypothetical protein [Leptolyngbya sp. FACHB-16]
MNSNASDSKDSVFVTPDPSLLQSDENKTDLKKQYPVPEEVVAGETDLPESSSGGPTFDPDEISRGETDAAIASDDRNQENLLSRQVGITFHSGS